MKYRTDDGQEFNSESEAQDHYQARRDTAAMGAFMNQAAEALTTVMIVIIAPVAVIVWAYVLIMDYAWIQLSLMPLIVLLQVMGVKFAKLKSKDSNAIRRAADSWALNVLGGFFRMGFLRPLSGRFTGAYKSLSKTARNMVIFAVAVVSVGCFFAATVYYSRHMEISRFSSAIVSAAENGEGPAIYSRPLWFGRHQGEVIGRLPAGERVQIAGITRVPLANYLITVFGALDLVYVAYRYKESKAAYADAPHFRGILEGWMLPKRQFKIVTPDGTTGFVDSHYFPVKGNDRIFAPSSVFIPYYAIRGIQYSDMDGAASGEKIIHDTSILMEAVWRAVQYLAVIGAFLGLGFLAAHLLKNRAAPSDASDDTADNTGDEKAETGAKPNLFMALFFGVVCAIFGSPLIAVLWSSGGPLSAAHWAIGALACLLAGFVAWRFKWKWLKNALISLCVFGFTVFIPMTEGSFLKDLATGNAASVTAETTTR